MRQRDGPGLRVTARGTGVFGVDASTLLSIVNAGVSSVCLGWYEDPTDDTERLVVLPDGESQRKVTAAVGMVNLLVGDNE